MATKARGQITIVDLNDGRSINVYLNTSSKLTQIYDTNSSSGKYTPDFTSENLVITPEVYVSGLGSNLNVSGGSAVLSNVVWKVNNKIVTDDTSKADRVTGLWVVGTGSSCNINVGNAVPYALTIKRNMTDDSQWHIEFSATFTDPETTLETPVKATIDLVKVNNAGNSCVAIMYTPDGSTISKNQTGGVSEVKLHCDLWRGSVIDESDVKYQWQQKVNGAWANVTEGTNLIIKHNGDSLPTSDRAKGDGNELIVKADAVTNFETFKCVIKDLDSGAATYNKTFEDTITVVDTTDPYTIRIDSTTGNMLTKSATSTTLTAVVEQNGEALTTQPADANFKWTKYDKNGTKSNFYNTSSSEKIGKTLTVGKDDVSVRATFTVEVTI